MADSIGIFINILRYFVLFAYVLRHLRNIIFFVSHCDMDPFRPKGISSRIKGFILIANLQSIKNRY